LNSNNACFELLSDHGDLVLATAEANLTSKSSRTLPDTCTQAAFFFLRVKGRGENPLPEYIDGAMFEPKAYNIDLQQIWKTTPTEQDKRTTWE